MRGPLDDAETVQRMKDGLGCMCRHEWLADEPHCDGPLTAVGGGLCWACAFVRRCEQPPALLWFNLRSRRSPLSPRVAPTLRRLTAAEIKGCKLPT